MTLLTCLLSPWNECAGILRGRASELLCLLRAVEVVEGKTETEKCRRVHQDVQNHATFAHLSIHQSVLDLFWTIQPISSTGSALTKIASEERRGTTVDPARMGSSARWLRQVGWSARRLRQEPFGEPTARMKCHWRARFELSAQNAELRQVASTRKSPFLKKISEFEGCENLCQVVHMPQPQPSHARHKDFAKNFWLTLLHIKTMSC